VAPPRGDAARGRAIFIRLACAGCHAVPDQSFPAPTRPGPDLAGIGARPASDIVEAIKNASAHDGAGLTAEELSDLAEYLGSVESAGPPAGPSLPSGSGPPSNPPAPEPPAGERSAEPR
jgi:mono/diheme cytochrome c family protein